MIRNTLPLTQHTNLCLSGKASPVVWVPIHVEPEFGVGVNVEADWGGVLRESVCLDASRSRTAARRG